MDQLTLLITWLGLGCLLVAEGVLLYSLVRFRRRDRGRPLYLTGEGWVQARWVLIPVLLVALLDFYIDAQNHGVWAQIKEHLPSAGESVRVVGRQFSWTFIYPGPDGRLDTDDDFQKVNELHVPVDTDVTFELQARDVVHSLWIPALRLKQDAVPGRTIRGWFRAQRTGRFDIACAEICGVGHSLMAARLEVHPEEEYRRWVAENARAER
jgi:cytochrome c oxidase subunit 2